MDVARTSRSPLAPLSRPLSLRLPGHLWLALRAARQRWPGATTSDAICAALELALRPAAGDELLAGDELRAAMEGALSRAAARRPSRDALATGPVVEDAAAIALNAGRVDQLDEAFASLPAVAADHIARALQAAALLGARYFELTGELPARLAPGAPFTLSGLAAGASAEESLAAMLAEAEASPWRPGAAPSAAPSAVTDEDDPLKGTPA